MTPTKLLLKIYGEQSNGQWSLVCLDFSLAAQADTLDEAKAKLEDQIKEFLSDVLQGDEREYAPSLLMRRAPLIYWIKWWMGIVERRLLGHAAKQHQAFRRPVPLVPAWS